LIGIVPAVDAKIIKENSSKDETAAKARHDLFRVL
jgi:hypothetical protein